MALFLQIVGGFVVAVVLIIVAFVLFIRVKFGKYLGAAEQQTPLQIHLIEDVAPEWLQGKAATATCEGLLDLGFTAGKCYYIDEMEGYFLKSFFRGPVVAAVYWNELVGVWTDLVVDEVGGLEYTFSNAPMGGNVANRPESLKRFDKNADVQALYDMAQKTMAETAKAFVDVNSSNFREYFEAAYRKDTAWKNRNGGLSFEEFLAIEKNDVKSSHSQKQIKEAFVDFKEEELEQWHEAAILEYLNQANIEEEKRHELEYGLFIVPFTTDAEAFIRYLVNQSILSDRQQDGLIKQFGTEKDIPALFEQLNDLLSADLRASFLAEVDYPLPVKLFKRSGKHSLAC